MRREVKALVDGVDEFIGIDHHKLSSQVLVRDREGNVLKRGQIASRQGALTKFLGPANGRVRMAVFEAGPRYRPMYRWRNRVLPPDGGNENYGPLCPPGPRRSCPAEYLFSRSSP